MSPGVGILIRKNLARYVEKLLINDRDCIGIRFLNIVIISVYFRKDRKYEIMDKIRFYLNKEDKAIKESPVTAEMLALLVKRISDNTISGKIAKDVFVAMWAGEGDADAIIEKKGLKQITDTGAIEAMIAEVIKNNPELSLEMLYEMPLPDTGGEEIFLFLFNNLNSFSSMEGIEYYSANKDRMTLYLEKCFLVEKKWKKTNSKNA